MVFSHGLRAYYLFLTKLFFAGLICDKGSFLKSKKIAIAIAAWVPWITDSYAIGRVVEKLGGPDARLNCLGEDIAAKEVPTEVY